MDCIYQCPGLAIFGYHLRKDWLFFPIEYNVDNDSDVYIVDKLVAQLGYFLILIIEFINNKWFNFSLNKYEI